MFIGRILAALILIMVFILCFIILIFLLPIMFFLGFLMLPLAFISSIFAHPGALKWLIVASLIIIALIIAFVWS